MDQKASMTWVEMEVGTNRRRPRIAKPKGDVSLCESLECD